MPNNKNIGVITEQGFVAGNGLGFNPVNEKDLNIENKEDKETNSNASNK